MMSNFLFQGKLDIFIKKRQRMVEVIKSITNAEILHGSCYRGIYFEEIWTILMV